MVSTDTVKQERYRVIIINRDGVQLADTVYAEISAVCKFRGFHGHLCIWISEKLIRENLLISRATFVIRENIIAKILFASCSAKISYPEIFRVYGSSTPFLCNDY